jgi:hypothetical protein
VVKTYFDQKTGLKVRQYTDVAGASVTEWSDYRDTPAGVKVPYKIGTTLLGQPVDFEVKDVRVNSGVGSEVFK